jgi:hypothetical protein
MYNKKEWVNDEIITKEALNNMENGIADLDAKMNDVATKKELQVIENNIAENNNELNGLKEGLVASLVAQGHKVDVNSSWKDLFDILLTGSGSVPDVPVDGDGIVLMKDGILGDPNTPFRNLCDQLSSTDGCGYQEGNGIVWNFDMTHGKGYAWFSFDGYVDFNDYEKVKIKCFTEYSAQQPIIIIYHTTKPGQTGYSASSSEAILTNHNLFDTEAVMTNVTPTYYELDIDASVLSNGKGYLLITMDQGNGSEVWGRFFITDIIVYPKKTEIPESPGEEIVLLNDGEYFNDTEFGSLCATPGLRDLIDNNGALVYELNTLYKTAFFSFGDTDDQYVNFNNYDAVELTVYTENNNQVPYIQVCRAGGTTNSPSGQYGYGDTVYPVNIREQTGFYVNTKKVPTVYTVNMAELRKASADMGSLLFIIERGDESNTADGKVYISKIVVYPEGTYYTESIDE